MTLTEQNEEIKKIVLWMLSELLSRLEDSRMDIGRFLGVDTRSNGTEAMSTNWMENGIKLLKAWCSTLPKADILHFVPAALWQEENWKAREKEWKPFTSTVVMKQLSWFFAQFLTSISFSVYVAVADLRKELARDSRWCTKTRRSCDNLESMVGTDRIS